MRRMLLLVAVAFVAFLALLPSPGTASAGDASFDAGLPARFHGDTRLQADAAQVFLDGAPGAFVLQHSGARIRTASLAGSLLEPLAYDAGTLEVAAGALTIAASGTGARVAIEGTSVAVASRVDPGAPADAWDQANLRIHALLHPRAISADDDAASPAILQVEAGRYEARMRPAQVELDASRVILVDVALAANGIPVSLDAAHVLIIEPQDGRLVLDAGSKDLAVFTPQPRVDLDGYVQFPWATGRLTTRDDDLRLDGDQLLVGGRLTWTALDASLTGAAAHWAGAGEFRLLHTGARPAPVGGPSPVLVGAGAGLAAVGLGATIWAWPWLRALPGLLVAPLYARLPNDRVLEHPGRELVYERIRQEPGVSSHHLARAVDFGWSTLAYHLRVLERTGLVVSVRDGRYKRYFDRASGRYANGRKQVVSVLKNPTTLALGRLVVEAPGLTQKDLSARAGLAPSSVHWHVERLQDVGLLEKQRDGHNVRYRPGPAWSEVHPEDVGLPARAAPPAVATAPPPLPAADGV